jgi:hypothetical protein
VQGGADADGAVLLPRDVGEPAHRLDVVDRRESETLRPLRERAGGEAHAGVLDERVPRIGADVTGTPCGVCAARAWVVVPDRRLPGGADGVHVEVRQVLAAHDRGRRRLRDAPGASSSSPSSPPR